MTPPTNRGMNGAGKNKMRKAVFTIHLDHKVGAATTEGRQPPSDGVVTFSSEREFRKIVAEWPGMRLVEIWNQLSGVKPVIRFQDRNTAIRRIWAAVQDMAGSKESVAKHPTGATKAERVVALLKAPTGASLRAIMELTGWQSHSVRGFISAQLSKRMGFKIQSFKRDGERIYQIRS